MKKTMIAGVSVLGLLAVAAIGGCQGEKAEPSTRPIGAVPNAATNDQGNQSTPPVIHFNQSDHN